MGRKQDTVRKRLGGLNIEIHKNCMDQDLMIQKGTRV